MSSYLDRLEGEINRLGVTFVSQKTGVARNTVYNWLAKGNVPLNYLMVLGTLGVDVIYVLSGKRQGGGASVPTQEQDSPLTPEERALLENFRHCSPDTRAAIKATSDALAQRRKKKTG
ncbi:hypothetical protein [Pseudomonas aeruginosa]|uniref:hypothetical protein n=1 Tax=Pseudomonas aeruginosa TaxID=287 RepID=UPI0014955362|nr:hypothetical protein [Pseudomonas aeruginosa]